MTASTEGKRPADVVIEEDGTTWVRIEGDGVAVLVNLEELRRPPVPGPVYVGPVGAVPVPPVADYMWRASVVPGLIGSGYTFGGAA